MLLPLLTSLALAMPGSSVQAEETCDAHMATIESCAALCEAGDGQACGHLGIAFLGFSDVVPLSNATPRDGELAAEYLERGCALGDGSSCVSRVRFQIFTHQPEADEEADVFFPVYQLPNLSLQEVLAFTKRGCELSPEAACAGAGTQILHAPLAELGHLSDDLRARFLFRMEHGLPLFERGCEAGDVEACGHIATLLTTAGIALSMDVDWDEVEQAAQRVCEDNPVMGPCRNWHDVLLLKEFGPYDPAQASVLRVMICGLPSRCDPQRELFFYTPENIAYEQGIYQPRRIDAD